MKLFKKLASLCLAIGLTLGLGAFAACGDGNNSSSSSSSSSSSAPAEATGYKFTVKYADGTAAVGMQIQICKGTDICLAPVATDANGVAEVTTGTFGEYAYEIHILNLPSGYTFSPTTTPATYGEVVVTLTAE